MGDFYDIDPHKRGRDEGLSKSVDFFAEGGGQRVGTDDSVTGERIDWVAAKTRRSMTAME